MKIAIIGSGICALSCAIECEKLGVIPDIFERDVSTGWVWPSIGFWPKIFFRDKSDIISYIRDNYGINLRYKDICKKIIMKSPSHEVQVTGDMGYFILRGKAPHSVENQLLYDLVKSTVAYNRPADYKELSEKYDWVVVATGSDAVARELKVWEDDGLVHMYGGMALGSFDPNSSTIYFNTEYAGTGYARVTPFNSIQAIVGLYDIGHGEFETSRLFSAFLERENLKHLEFLYKVNPQPFTTGRVSKFRVGNILLAGRAAGLTEQLLGVGGTWAIISGVLAARAIIQNQDYDALMKPLQEEVNTISTFRKVVNSYTNEDFDRLVKLLGLPGVKQLVYKTPINFVDMAGTILKKLQDS